MKRILGFVFVVLCLSTIQFGLTQERNIEDRIPAELLAQDKSLVRLQGELRQVRRSFSKIGKKHPSWARTNQRIISLEEQIQRTIEALTKVVEPDPGQPSFERPAPTSPSKMGPGNGSDASENPIGSTPDSRAKKPSRTFRTEFPLDRWMRNTVRWSDQIRYEGYDRIGVEKLNIDELVRLEPAFPFLNTQSVVCFGAVPGQYLGNEFLWGVENDQELAISRIWVWGTSRDSQRKKLWLQTDGSIVDMLFADDFPSTGKWFAIKRDLSEGAKRSFQLVKFISDPEEQLPNRKIMREETLVSFTADRRADIDRFNPRLWSGAHGVHFLTANSGFSLVQTTEGVFGKQVDPLTYCFDEPTKELEVRDASRHWIGLASREKKRSYQTLEISPQGALLQDRHVRESNLVFRSWTKDSRRNVEAFENLAKALDPLSANPRGAVMAGSRLLLLSDDGYKISCVKIGEEFSGEREWVDIGGARSTRLVYRGREKQLMVSGEAGIRSIDLGISSNGPSPSLDKVTGRTLGELDRISKLGVFEDASKRLVSDWLIAYEVSIEESPHGTNLNRYVGLPKGAQIRTLSNGAYEFPDGTVFLVFFAPGPVTPYSKEANQDLSVLYRSKGRWIGLRYRWLEDWTDAVLVQCEPLDGLVLEPGVRLPTSSKPTKLDCWECHRSTKNSGILGFRSDKLLSVTSDDRLQELGFVQIGLLDTSSWNLPTENMQNPLILEIESQVSSVVRNSLEAMNRDLAQEPSIDEVALILSATVDIDIEIYTQMYFATGEQEYLDRVLRMAEKELEVLESELAKDGLENQERAEKTCLIIKVLCNDYLLTGDKQMLVTAGRYVSKLRPLWEETQWIKDDPSPSIFRMNRESRCGIACCEALLDFYSIAESAWALEDLEFLFINLTHGPDFQFAASTSNQSQLIEPSDLFWIYRFWSLTNKLASQLDQARQLEFVDKARIALGLGLRQLQQDELLGLAVSFMVEMETLSRGSERGFDGLESRWRDLLGSLKNPSRTSLGLDDRSKNLGIKLQELRILADLYQMVRAIQIPQVSISESSNQGI